jgi:hypothetical protein
MPLGNVSVVAPPSEELRRIRKWRCTTSRHKGLWIFALLDLPAFLSTSSANPQHGDIWGPGSPFI